MDAIVTIANCFFILSHIVKDLLWVRALSLIGACCLAFYFGFCSEPLMHVAFWNLFFAALNAIWVFRLVLQRPFHRRPGLRQIDKA